MIWTIYKHTNKFNNKIYIGQTCQTLHRRWGKDGKNYEGSPKFWPAIQEYGWNNFSHEVIETNILTQTKANEREQYWIAFYDSYNTGYNATLGGTFEEVEVICVETQEIFPSLSLCAAQLDISTQNLSQNACINHRTCKGLHFAYLSEYNENWQPAPEYDTARRKEVSTLKKEVYCLETNSFYDSATSAGEATGVGVRYVCKCCEGELIQTHGYHYCWKEDWYEGWQPRDSKQGQHIITNEMKENMKQAALKSKGIKIGQYSLSGELIAIFNNYQEGQDATGTKKDNIGRCVRTNRTRTERLATANGFIWLEYKE